MSRRESVQTTWEETNEEIVRRLELSRSAETGWLGTIIGLVLAAAALLAIWLT